MSEKPDPIDAALRQIENHARAARAELAELRRSPPAPAIDHYARLAAIINDDGSLSTHEEIALVKSGEDPHAATTNTVEGRAEAARGNCNVAGAIGTQPVNASSTGVRKDVSAEDEAPVASRQAAPSTASSALHPRCQVDVVVEPGGIVRLDIGKGRVDALRVYVGVQSLGLPRAEKVADSIRRALACAPTRKCSCPPDEDGAHQWGCAFSEEGAPRG